MDGIFSVLEKLLSGVEYRNLDKVLPWNSQIQQIQSLEDNMSTGGLYTEPQLVPVMTLQSMMRPKPSNIFETSSERASGGSPVYDLSLSALRK